MGAVFPYAFDISPAIGRYFPPQRKRLLVALVFSAFLHLWLVAGTTADVPAAAGSHRAVAAFTARLEAPATVRPPDQSGIAGQGPRAGGKPVAGSASRSPAISPPPVPSPAGGGAARVAVPVPQPDPVYYPAQQLDAYPALLQPVKLEYPDLPDKADGRVLVMLLIDETGAVDEISIAEAEPAGYFEHAVHAAFSNARFSPARKDGRAVKSRVLVRVNYGPGEAEGTLR